MIISEHRDTLFLALVHPDNSLLGFLTYSTIDALRCIELSRGEFLLVFQTLAVYVDSQGRKSRDREIMYPAVPTGVSKCSFYYCKFTGSTLYNAKLWSSTSWDNTSIQIKNENFHRNNRKRNGKTSVVSDKKIEKYRKKSARTIPQVR